MPPQASERVEGPKGSVIQVGARRWQLAAAGRGTEPRPELVFTSSSRPGQVRLGPWLGPCAPQALAGHPPPDQLCKIQTGVTGDAVCLPLGFRLIEPKVGTFVSAGAMVPELHVFLILFHIAASW